MIKLFLILFYIKGIILAGLAVWRYPMMRHNPYGKVSIIDYIAVLFIPLAIVFIIVVMSVRYTWKKLRRYYRKRIKKKKNGK